MYGIFFFPFHCWLFTPRLWLWNRRIPYILISISFRFHGVNIWISFVEKCVWKLPVILPVSVGVILRMTYICVTTMKTPVIVSWHVKVCSSVANEICGCYNGSEKPFDINVVIQWLLKERWGINNFTHRVLFSLSRKQWIGMLVSDKKLPISCRQLETVR